MVDFGQSFYTPPVFLRSCPHFAKIRCRAFRQRVSVGSSFIALLYFPFTLCRIQPSDASRLGRRVSQLMFPRQSFLEPTTGTIAYFLLPIVSL
jgi:hypothetical protein